MLENGNIYVGERYLPIGAGAWDITKQYEQLVMVTHEGATYISTKPVPSNTELTNTEYWLPMYQPSDTITELQDDVAQNMADIADIYQKLANGGNGSPVFVDMRDVENVVNGNVINIDNLPDDASKVYVVPNDKDYQMTSNTDGVRAVIAIPPSNNYNITLLSNIRLVLQPIFFPHSMLIDCGNYKFTAPLPVVKQQWCVDTFNIFSDIIHTIQPAYIATSTNIYNVMAPCTVDGENMTECAYGFTVHNDTVFKNIRFTTNGDTVTINNSAKITFEHCEFALTNSNFRIVNANDKILDLTFKDCTFKKPCAALGGGNIITNNFTFENCKFNEQVILLDQGELLHNVRFIGCTCYENHGISLRSTKWSLDIEDSSMQIIHSGTTENTTNLSSTYSQIQINGSGNVMFKGVSNSEIYLNTTRCNLGNSISNSEITGNGTTLPLTAIGGGVFSNTRFVNLDVIAEMNPPVRTFSVCSFTNTTLGELNNAVYLNGDSSVVPSEGGSANNTGVCYFHANPNNLQSPPPLSDGTWQFCNIGSLSITVPYTSKPGTIAPFGWLLFPSNNPIISNIRYCLKGITGSSSDYRVILDIVEFKETDDGLLAKITQPISPTVLYEGLNRIIYKTRYKGATSSNQYKVGWINIDLP